MKIWIALSLLIIVTLLISLYISRRKQYCYECGYLVPTICVARRGLIYCSIGCAIADAPYDTALSECEEINLNELI